VIADGEVAVVVAEGEVLGTEFRVVVAILAVYVYIKNMSTAKCTTV
jgi:hypothetical protein